MYWHSIMLSLGFPCAYGSGACFTNDLFAQVMQIQTQYCIWRIDSWWHYVPNLIIFDDGSLRGLCFYLLVWDPDLTSCSPFGPNIWMASTLHIEYGSSKQVVSKHGSNHSIDKKNHKSANHMHNSWDALVCMSMMLGQYAGHLNLDLERPSPSYIVDKQMIV